MAFVRRLCDQTDDAERWRLRRRLTTLGAAPSNDLEVTGTGVADEHATIVCEGPHFAIRPAGPDTQVRVDDQTVERKRILEHGDNIEIGEVRLEFRHLGDEDDDPTGLTERDHRRLQGLEHIHHLSLQLLEARQLDELFETLIDSVVELTDAAKGLLLLAEDGDFAVRVARHVDAGTLTDDEHRLSDSVLQWVAEHHEPIVVADARNDEQFHNAQSVIDLQLSSVMCAPLLDDGQLLGAVYVGNDRVADLFDDLDLELLSVFTAQLSLVVSNAILLDELETDRDRLEQQLQQRRFGSLIGASDQMEPVFHAIDRVAPTDVTVLITGETGTGKELVARELHHRSNRADGPCVTLNCGAIPENLLESELFGHVEGAFTGADATRDGKFHAADGGTIVLDEIGEMPPDLQVKLLRVLQERTVSRVGSNQRDPVDIRILAATNRDLEDDVETGDFREDLYYRLNVVEIELPPLRERGDDVVLIARYLIDKISDELDIAPRQLSRDAVRALKKYDWPGNIRQLENRLKKALVMSTSSTLNAEDLDLPASAMPEIKPLDEAKEEFALEYVLEILERNDGNRSQTARDLDVDPRTVFRYLERRDSS